MRKFLHNHFRSLTIGCALTAGMAGGVQAQVLLDNGPYFNSTGTGAGGANESVLYTTTFSMGTIGFGHQVSGLNRVADDFVINDCRWQVDSIVFFGYQTGSTTTSTFTAVNFRIWSGEPDAPGSTIVYGDTTTNRLTATRWSGAYRITETTTGNTQRPIMRNVCSTPGLVVNNGTFWLDWQSAGSLASGPWAPPRTPAATAITGNGKQRVSQVWNNLVDGGTGNPAQGLPFIIYGTAIPQPSADAGADLNLCPGLSSMIGGSPAASGGTGPYSYSWSPGASLSDSTTGQPTASPAASTTYVLTLTDANGCMDMDTMTYTVGNVASQFLPADTTICPGSTIILDAGTATSYLWSTNDTTQSITVVPGTYSVQAFDALGCASVDTIVVAEAASTTISGDSSICQGASGVLMASGSGSFVWSTGSTTDTIHVSQAGSYSVTLTDGSGCTSSSSYGVSIAAGTSASFSYNVGAGGLSISFTDLSTNATSWAWSFGDGGTSTSSSPTHVYGTSGSYTVTLIATGDCGADTTSLSLVLVNVEQTLAGAAIEISPNPAQGRFEVTIAGLATGELDMELSDMVGKVHAAYHSEDAAAGVHAVVDASRLSAGSYFLRITHLGKTETRKVVLK